jgi:hypothetical protein
MLSPLHARAARGRKANTVTIPAASAKESNAKMAAFFNSQSSTPLMLGRARRRTRQHQHESVNVSNRKRGRLHNSDRAAMRSAHTVRDVRKGSSPQHDTWETASPAYPLFVSNLAAVADIRYARWCSLARDHNTFSWDPNHYAPPHAIQRPAEQLGQGLTGKAPQRDDLSNRKEQGDHDASAHLACRSLLRPNLE